MKYSYCFRFCGLFGGVQDMFCRHNFLPDDGSPHDRCQKLKGPEGGHTKRVRSCYLSTNLCASLCITVMAKTTDLTEMIRIPLEPADE